jgi:hypothetical protein
MYASVDYFCQLNDSFFEKYAIGWPCCPKTASTPVPKAYVSRVKGFEKLGKLSTSAVVIACLRQLIECSFSFMVPHKSIAPAI